MMLKLAPLAIILLLVGIITPPFVHVHKCTTICPNISTTCHISVVKSKSETRPIWNITRALRLVKQCL